MNQIAELLPVANIALDVDVGTKSRLFEAAGALFAASSGIDGSLVATSLAAREKLGSTGLGQGVAIPHGRIKGLKEARGAFVRLKQPVPFDAPDGKPVSQVFVLLVPEQATDLHLQLLSELAQMFSEKGFREKLSGATTTAALLALFRRGDRPLELRLAMNAEAALRQISVQRLFDDNADRLGLHWKGGRQGGNRVLTGDSELKPTVGQVGHMNLIHPFRIQILGAAEGTYLRGLAATELRALINRLFTPELVAIVVANGEVVPPYLPAQCDPHHSRCSPRRSPRRTWSTSSGCTCRACSPSRRRCTACSSTCSRWAC